MGPEKKVGMPGKPESEIKQLRSKGARHTESAQVLRGSMSSTPSPDDFEQAKRIEAERNRAKDSGALADYLVDQKTKALERYFQEQMGCTVFHQWDIDLHCHRFYFRKEQAAGWRYILDVDQDLVDEQNPAEIIEQLEAGRWKEVLEAHSGKRVPRFKDGAFSPAATFSDWPAPVATDEKRGKELE